MMTTNYARGLTCIIHKSILFCIPLATNLREITIDIQSKNYPFYKDDRSGGWKSSLTSIGIITLSTHNQSCLRTYITHRII